ncbi:ABC transporter ATP-binding protein [Dermabacteraceae bacterium P13115]|nr:ATP-binding cassette domain-containing protein [Dermabacteraceae bacterium TAE3-ERU27]
MVNISAQNLGIAIEGNSVFENVTLECGPGVMMALTGPSGCGKSTLLNALGLVLPPSVGDVLVDGVSTKNWSDKQRFAFWKQHAAFIYQDYGVIEAETLSFNITLGGQLKSATYQRPEEVLEIVGLQSREKEHASVLSGGEKQRLGIARAMYKDSHVLFADEPTASLDPANRDMIIELLRLATARGMSVIVATHDDYLAQACPQKYRLP